MTRAKSNRPKDCPYVSKGGLKLQFALEHFQINVTEKITADFGSHQGGFVDCLLQHQANKVYSIDTSYGTLAWNLRTNPKVIVFERMNAMHWKAPEPIDIVTIDVAWTKQQHILPSAMQAIQSSGIVLSLLKPQYETTQHILSKEEVMPILQQLLPWLEQHFQQVSYAFSPYEGSGGNIEVWLCLSKKI